MSQEFEANLKVHKAPLKEIGRVMSSCLKSRKYNLTFLQAQEKRRAKKEKATAKKAARQAEKAVIKKAADDIRKCRRALAEAEKVSLQQMTFIQKEKR